MIIVMLKMKRSLISSQFSARFNPIELKSDPRSDLCFSIVATISIRLKFIHSNYTTNIYKSIRLVNNYSGTHLYR